MKASIFHAFVWTAVNGGYTYACHAMAAHTSAEAEEILKGDFLIQPGDAVFINTDEHIESYTRSGVLAYYTNFSHPTGATPIGEYANWVDNMTKARNGFPAVYRMV